MVELNGRSLTADFAGWLDRSGVDPARFLRNGLVVLDANVLLSLYRFAPAPRAEVLSVLSAVGDRLWVPHQAALEFSRNRTGAVQDRVRTFATVRTALASAPRAAMDAIEAALGQFRNLRERSATTRPWGPSEHQLNPDELLARLSQAIEPVLAELAAMQDEHDLQPPDVSGVDPVLRQLDALIVGRIGAGYASTRLHQLVDEAMSFRYPNEIPPGFRDGGKETAIRRAGDFLLWQQTIDRANELPRDHRRVLLVTNDLKDDWWQVDDARRRLGPRPELVQELRDRAGADLLLRTLDEFVSDARTHLPVRVTEQTIDVLRTARDGLDWPLPEVTRDPSTSVNLMELSPSRFDSLVYHLLVRLGFTAQVADRSNGDIGFDFRLTSQPEGSDPERIVAAVKRVRSRLDESAVIQVLGAMRANGVDGGLVITTATFSAEAQSLARAANVRLIDGPRLRSLLTEHLDVHARID